MDGGVRGSPSATHGRHWLRCANVSSRCISIVLIHLLQPAAAIRECLFMCREWEVLGLVSQELRRKAELPRTGNPAKGSCDLMFNHAPFGNGGCSVGSLV